MLILTRRTFSAFEEVEFKFLRLNVHSPTRNFAAFQPALFMGRVDSRIRSGYSAVNSSGSNLNFQKFSSYSCFQVASTSFKPILFKLDLEVSAHSFFSKPVGRIPNVVGRVWLGQVRWTHEQLWGLNLEIATYSSVLTY